MRRFDFRSCAGTSWSLIFRRIRLKAQFACPQGIYNPKLGRSYLYDEKLVVPIIENTPYEKDLEGRMKEVLQEYPETSAVLVRRHGVYVWGETWQKTKSM